MPIRTRPRLSMTRRILRFDPVRQRRIIVIGIGRHLPGDRTQPSAAVAWLYGATGCDALRDHQKLDHGESLERERREVRGKAEKHLANRLILRLGAKKHDALAPRHRGNSVPADS